MPEKTMPFIVTDRRKFNLDGEPRPDADPSPVKERPREERAAPVEAPPAPVRSVAAAPQPGEATAAQTDPDLPPPPTAEQMDKSRTAYEQTADRLDTAVRAANPGAEHLPPMSFEQIVQSVYMSSIMQLGGGTPEGQKPQIDLMGARQSIDMLGILAEKTRGNLTQTETQMIESALFELRLAFLDITQALARQAQANMPGQPGAPGRPSGPSIVR